jgi:hypothetical protein
VLTESTGNVFFLVLRIIIRDNAASSNNRFGVTDKHGTRKLIDKT